MRTVLLRLVAVLLLTLLPVSALRADGIERERFVLALEGLLAELAGTDDVRPVVTRLDNGLTRVSVPLSPEALRRFKVASAKPLSTLANGHSLEQLADFSATVTAVLSSLNTDYNFWWVAVNTGADDLEKKTTNTLTGPSPKQKRDDDVVYPKGALSGFGFLLENAFTETGRHQQKTKIKGAGPATAKYRPWAQ